jgi:hypothetical protein
MDEIAEIVRAETSLTVILPRQDLRVLDRALSAAAGLIGAATAPVTDGERLWGSAELWYPEEVDRACEAATTSLMEDGYDVATLHL